MELALAPPRAHHHGPKHAAPHRAHAAAGEDSGLEEGDAAAWEPQRARRRTLPLAAESDYSEQSDAETEERRRSLRPRRARPHAREYLEELRTEAAAAGSGGAAPGSERMRDARSYESDGGSELSSVQLVDDAAAERQRCELINRLVKEALSADFEGGCCCVCLLRASRQAGCRPYACRAAALVAAARCRWPHVLSLFLPLPTHPSLPASSTGPSQQAPLRA